MKIEGMILTLRKETRVFDLPMSDKVEITTKNPFKVLVATILSARTNDKTTFKIARKLFEQVENASNF